MAVGHLAHYLHNCTRLTILYLYKSNITNQGVIELALKFHCIPNLTYLDIRKNSLTNTGFDAVFRYIHHLTNLESYILVVVAIINAVI